MPAPSAPTSSTTDTGSIVGGAVGEFIGLALLGSLVFIGIRRGWFSPHRRRPINQQISDVREPLQSVHEPDNEPDSLRSVPEPTVPNDIHELPDPQSVFELPSPSGPAVSNPSVCEWAVMLVL
jgi:hypothetical protein